MVVAAKKDGGTRLKGREKMTAKKPKSERVDSWKAESAAVDVIICTGAGPPTGGGGGEGGRGMAIR